MTKIGYARVSAADMSLTAQVERLRAEGCAIIRQEKVSGASREGRDELAAILDFLRPQDEVCCVRLDRLGRSTRDVLNIVHEIDQRGASLTILDPHISTKGDVGRIVISCLSMVAEMERTFIKSRQRAGIDAALKAKDGRYAGGKRRIDRAKVESLKAEGKGPTEIAKALGVSRMQVHRILKAA